MLIGTVAGLFLLGGLPGAVFGLTALGVWLVTPPVFAFVLAQAGVAAVTAPPYSTLVFGVEAALLVGVLSDSGIPFTIRSRVAAAGAVTAIAGGLWLNDAQPVWLAAGSTLAVVAVFLYAVHRYELLSTNQLEQ